MAEKERTISHG